MRAKRRYTLSPPTAFTPCFYCFIKPATGWDHLIPVSAGGGGDDANLVPSCKRCNGLASNFLFRSVEEKRVFVVARLSGQNGIDAVTLFRSFPAVHFPSSSTKEKPEPVKIVTKKRGKTLEDRQARVAEYRKTYQGPAMATPTSSVCPCCGQPVVVRCLFCNEVIQHPRISSNPGRTQKYCTPAHRLAHFRQLRGKTPG